MVLLQRPAIHFVGQQDVVALDHVPQGEASREVLQKVLVADFLDFLVRAEEDDFDGAFQWMTFLEQGGERRAGPADIADGAHETGIGAVAGTLERGGHGLALARLDFRDCKSPRLLHQAGDVQSPLVEVNRRIAIVADAIELVVGRDPRAEVLPVKHPALGLHVEERHHRIVRDRFLEAEE